MQLVVGPFILQDADPEQTRLDPGLGLVEHHATQREFNGQTKPWRNLGALKEKSAK